MIKWSKLFVAIYHLIFGAKFNILFIIKVVIRAPGIKLTIEPRSVKHILSTESNLFYPRVFLVLVLRSTAQHIPLKYKCPNYLLCAR